MSPVGKTKDAGWQIGVSRTVGAPAADVWELLVSERGTAIWLGAGARLGDPGDRFEAADGTTGEIRSLRPLDRVRLTWRPPDWDHDSTVQVAIADKGDRTGITPAAPASPRSPPPAGSRAAQ